MRIVLHTEANLDKAMIGRRWTLQIIFSSRLSLIFSYLKIFKEGISRSWRQLEWKNIGIQAFEVHNEG